MTKKQVKEIQAMCKLISKEECVKAWNETHPKAQLTLAEVEKALTIAITKPKKAVRKVIVEDILPSYCRLFSEIREVNKEIDSNKLEEILSIHREEIKRLTSEI